MYLKIIVLTVLLLTTISFSENVGNFEKGVYFFDMGLYERAIDEFTKIINKDPENIPARYWRARTMYFRGDNYKTNQQYQNLKSAKDSLYNLNSKAIHDFDMDAVSKYGKQEDSIQLKLDEITADSRFEFLKKIKSDMVWGHKYSERKQSRILYWWWITNQEEELSENCKDSLVSESNNNTELQIILAREYYFADSFDLAIRYASEIQNKNKQDFYSTYILMESYYAKRDLIKAIYYALKLLQLKKDGFSNEKYEFPCEIEINEFTLRDIVGCYYGLKDISGMESFLNTYANQYVKSFKIEFNEIVEMDTVKSFFRTEFFKVMLRFQTHQEGLLREISDYYKETNQIDSAITYYSILINYDEQTRSDRAELYFKKGQYSKSIDDYTYIIDRNVPVLSWTAHYFRAKCYLRLGNKREALKDFSLQSCITPNNWMGDESRKFMKDNMFEYKCD